MLAHVPTLPVRVREQALPAPWNPAELRREHARFQRELQRQIRQLRHGRARLTRAALIAQLRLPETAYTDYLRQRRLQNPSRFDRYHPALGALFRREQPPPPSVSPDTVAPVVAIQQPRDGVFTRGPVTLVGVATDDRSGLAWVQMLGPSGGSPEPSVRPRHGPVPAGAGPAA